MTISYAAQIRRVYPDLTVDTFRLLEGGQYNDVAVVNGTWLFRFPKVPPALATLAREVRVLQAIGAQLPLPVPHPIYVNLEGQPLGAAFMGYRLLPGDPLWRTDVARLAKEAERVARQMARTLAEFLHALHGLPPELVPADVQVKDTRATWEALYERIERQLFAYMRPAARREITAHFAAYLDDPSAFAFRPVLRHGDFGGGNILWSPAQRLLTGVIDFGSVAVGDAAMDLASLAAGFGERFLQWAGAHYPLTKAMRARITFYRGTFALYEALYGIEQGDEHAFAAGMAAYI